MGAPLHLRIFLSSPGDVGEERKIAREVLDRLPRDPVLAGKLTIEVIAWDDPNASTPLSGTLTPQEAVNAYNTPPSDCDLTVVILWSRLGTPLTPHIVKSEGTRYASGTEWEYEDARRARRETFVYQRTERPRMFIDDEQRDEKQRQYQAVRAFVAAFRAADGSLLGAANGYGAPSEFQTMFEQHLRKFINRRLEDRQSEHAGGAPEDSRFRIFLATNSDDTAALHSRLSRRLRAQSDIRLTSDIPPPDDQTQHAARVLEEVRAADLCVHVLGRESGDAIEGGESGRTYLVEQAALSLSHARSMLVLHPPEFSHEGVSDPQYRDFLEGLRNRSDESSRLERVQATDREELIRRVLNKRSEIEAARRRERAGAALTAFIDADSHDVLHIEKLVTYLSAKNVKPQLFGTEDGAAVLPSGLDARLADCLRRARLFLVAYGSADYDWVKFRVKKARDIIYENNLATELGVYVLPPRKKDGDVIFRGVTVVNHTAGFDEGALDQLLSQAAGAP